jgi:catechol 2,3-dioxygenase-like lactoylglutathione lyase family enzyme
MKNHITFITLGVDDLEKSVNFYQNGLGFTTKGIIGQEFENGAVAFFDMQPGLKLALWPKTSIARETGVTITSNSSTEGTTD